MDYFTLNRRELQALCKKHAIPANLTNVSMAEALTALLNVNNNKPSGDRFQKQQAKSEDTDDKSVLTDISNTPRKCTRSKKHEVATEGKSAEEPIVLDDDEAPSALKEKHVKSATKTLKGKGGDQTEKSRQRKILDKDVDESSDTVTPYTSVTAGRGRTCKRGTNDKNPRMRSCNATDTEDVKPVQQKHDSCENEEESEAGNNFTETRPKLSGKKIDKMELATEESNQVLTHTEDAKALLQEQESYERGGTVEVVPKTRAKRGLLRKKVDKVEMATEESFDANDQSVEVVLKTGPKARPSRNRVDKMEEATEESIQGSNNANDGPFEEVHETRHKSIRKKFDAVKEAAEDNIDWSTGANHNIEEDTRETTGTDDESVKNFSDIRFKGRSSRKKVDEVGKATGESKGTNDVNYESVEEISRTGPKGKLSRKKIEKATKESMKWTDDMNDEEISRTKRVSSSRKRSEKVAEENIQGVHDESKGDQNPICRRSTRANALSRSKYSGVDSVKETPGASERIKVSSYKKVEYDPAEASVKVSAKKHSKSPVHTRRALRALSTKNDSPKFLDGDAMEKSASKVSKQISICTRTNHIQISHDSSDVKNGGESNSDLDCSKIKQGRGGHRRTAKKATIKSHQKELDLLEADLAQETIEGMNITESYSGQSEPETKCNNLEVHENPAFSHGIDSRNAQTGEALCTVVKEIQGKTVQNGVVIAGPGRIQPQPMHLISNADDDATIPYGIKSKFLSQGEYMHVAESPNETELKTMYPGFKDEEGHAKSMKEGVSISESSNGIETETICAQEGKIKDEESQGVSIQEGVSKAESPNRTKPEIMCAQEGEASGIKDEVSQEETVQKDAGKAESPNGTKPETICAQEGKIKDEESQGVFIQEGVSKAESPNRTKPEIMCAQEGEASGTKDEVSQEETVQKDVGKAESPNGTKPETMCAQEGKACGSKDEENQGESMQDGGSIAESPNGAEPETLCAQESGSPGIKDKERQGRTVQKSVGIADSNNEIETQNMHSPGIKDEANLLKTIQEGRTVQKSVGIADSNNEIETQNMHSPGIKDEANLLKTIQEGISISESHNQTEPETMHLDPKVGAKQVFCYGMDSTCIEQCNEILIQNDYELNNFDDMKQLNCSIELLSSSSAREVNQVEGSMPVLNREPGYASWKETTPTMMVVQEIVIGEPGTVAGTEKDCLHTEAVGSDDLKCVVEKPSELQQCTANLGDETIDNIMEEVYKEIRSDIGTEEDPGAKNSEDLVLSVMPTILELPKREGTSFANVEGQDKNVPSEVHNNELCSHEVHVSFSEIKRQILVQNSPVTLHVKTEGAIEGKVPTGLEDVDDIQGHFSNNVSEAATSISIGNAKADLVERLAYLSIDNDDQTDVIRVRSSSVQVDNEAKDEKRMESSSVQIDSEDQIKNFSSELLDGKKELHSACICTVEGRIKDFTSHDETGSNKSPLAKELIHFQAKDFVQSTVKVEKLNGFNDETGSRKEFVPSTPPKEEQNILNAIDGENGSGEEFVPSTPPKEEQNILNTIDDERELPHVKLEILALSNTDEESEAMESQEAFKTTGEVEDLGLGNKNPLALQECEQHNTKELEETLCQAKAPLYMADTRFHEKTCGPDEQVQVTYVDKLQNEANNNVLLIEKKNSAPLTTLSLCNLRVMCKDKMAKASTHFQEKPCSKDEVTCGNNLQNEIKKENYDHLSLRKLKALYKEKKAGKRSALHNLSSNDLEEREKGPNKAELQITYGSQK